MAQLEDIAKSVNVNIRSSENTNPLRKTSGKKRRVWLEEEQKNTKIISEPIDSIGKGSIDTIKSASIDSIKTGSINRVTSESINRVNKSYLTFCDLRGNPRSVILLLASLADKEKTPKITTKINTSKISQLLDISINSVKTAIKFLSKNNLIKRTDSQSGKFGWTQYQLDENIYQQCIKIGSISSSSYININTTTNRNHISVDNLEEDWNTINLEPLRDIGLSANHLKQLANKNLNTAEIVQESINHFAYGLKYNKREFKTKPINVLMGVLRKGEAWIEDGYRSPQEIAQEQLLQQRKAEKERMKQLQEDAYKLALADWLETLSEEEKLAIAPAKKAGQIAMPQSVKLSLYFKENIWSEKKEKYLIHPK